jgi:hypothetical protein
MMMTHTIPLFAAVTTNERAVVEAAARHLAEALSRAASETWTCACEFAADFDGLVGATPGSVIVTSLLVPLAQADRPWPDVEKELRRTYAALCETGNSVVICTILRHVDAAGDLERADRIRRRLRQLNLLATELSREYGALVIDVDRLLADIGARRLETDYRLGGKAAADVASKAVALCIVTNALDALAPIEIQDAARAILESYRPSVGLATDQMMTNLLALGRGRRRQRVATVTNDVQENHVGWLVRQVLKGQIGGREALDRVTNAIRRRGARESAWLLISGVARTFRPTEMGRRR